MTDDAAQVDNQPVEGAVNAPPSAPVPQTPPQPQEPPQAAKPAGNSSFRPELAEKTLANPEVADGYIKMMIDKGMIPDPQRMTAMEIKAARADAIADYGFSRDEAANIPGNSAAEIAANAQFAAQYKKQAAQAAATQTQQPIAAQNTQPQSAPTPQPYSPPPAPAATPLKLELTGKTERERNQSLTAYFAERHRQAEE